MWPLWIYIISTVISLIVFNERVYNHIKNGEGETSDSAQFHIVVTGLAFILLSEKTPSLVGGDESDSSERS